jgi:SnoaL-like domain
MKMRFSLKILAIISLLLPLFNVLSTWEQVQQTIHTYPFAIDHKNFPLRREAFTPNAFANYTGPLSSLTGLQAIETTITSFVANVRLDTCWAPSLLTSTRIRSQPTALRISKLRSSARELDGPSCISLRILCRQARADETWLADRQ